MSEFKTNKISPRSGTTQTIGDSGDSVSTSSGSTINNAGTITTAGITGGTINNTTGEIYLRGEVDWKPGDIKTASFTATDNQGFFVNTTSGEITVTLPASPSAGDVVGIKDYANTFDTNKCILNANGNKIQGSTELFEITVEGSSIIIIYVDATQGWVITDASKAADISEAASFITATGGTVTTSGDFKIHTFTGPGTLCVSSAGNAAGSNAVDYLAVAGGGGGGKNDGGGGGAGGFRTTFPSPGCNAGAFPISVTTYPITVGGAGAGGTGPCNAAGSSGSNSIFSTITSAGGGGGGGRDTNNAASGGSGGGGSGTPANPAGSGNTPPVSPPQGNPGAVSGGTPTSGAGGGGGANAAGSTGNTPGPGGAGGAGSPNSISGCAVTRAGGGGGGAGSVGTGGAGGTGGGGKGGDYPTSSPKTAAVGGTANTGSGGGGGSRGGPVYCGGSGGSGIVIIRYKFQ